MLTTGNEDGGKHVSAQVSTHSNTSASPSHHRPTATAVGEAGPGPSYLDEEGGGQHNAWTTRNAVFMTWNMLHMARMLKDSEGIPAYGNSTHDWNLKHSEHPNPEYR